MSNINHEFVIVVPDVKMNFMPEGGMLHPFIKLYSRSAIDWDMDLSLYRLRSALASLLPAMSDHHLLLSKTAPGFILNQISSSNDLSSLLKGADYSCLLPYHQQEGAEVTKIASNLQPWAGLESPFWLIWSKAEYQSEVDVPEPLSVAIAAQVLSDFANYSLAFIRRDTEHKFIYLTGLLGSKNNINLIHSEVKSLIHFDTDSISQAEDLENALLLKKIKIKREGKLFSIANYPVHSKEAFYSLIDQLEYLL